jgi:hypothetical protein
MQLRSPEVKKRNANGAPGRGGAGGKLTFPKLISDPVCHNAAFLKGSFLKVFWEIKGAKTRVLRMESVSVFSPPTNSDKYEYRTSVF